MLYELLFLRQSQTKLAYMRRKANVGSWDRNKTNKIIGYKPLPPKQEVFVKYLFCRSRLLINNIFQAMYVKSPSIKNPEIIFNQTVHNLTSESIFSLLFQYIFFGTDKENLFNHQSVFKLAIISFILMTVVNDSAVLLWGEIRCWSILKFKGYYAIHLTCKRSEATNPKRNSTC